MTPFSPIAFSITNEARDAMAAKLHPIIERYADAPTKTIPGAYDAALLGTIIGEILPKEISQALCEMAKEGTHSPIIIHNLPQSYIEPTSVTNCDVTSNYIATGIYALLNATPTYSIILKRHSSRKEGSQPAGSKIHADPWALSALACPINKEQAPTRFFDWRSLAKNKEATDLLDAVQVEQGKQKLSLKTFLNVPLAGMQLTGADIANDNSLAQCNLEKQLKAYSTDIVLMPGDLVIWNNHAIFHQSQNGCLESLQDNIYSRVASFVGAHYSRS